jgi:hypothetical protein
VEEVGVRTGVLANLEGIGVGEAAGMLEACCRGGASTDKARGAAGP